MSTNHVEPFINDRVSWDLVERIVPESQGIWADWSPEHRETLMVRLDELLGKLPPVEVDILEGLLAGCYQEDLAQVFGVTQAAVSHRLYKAIKRLRCLIAWPPKPDSWDADLAEVKSFDYPIGPVIETVLRTTSQSVTAVEHGMHQSTVRDIYRRTLDHLKAAGRMDSWAHLAHLDNHWNVLREVPSWAVRSRGGSSPSSTLAARMKQRRVRE